MKQKKETLQWAKLRYVLYAGLAVGLYFGIANLLQLFAYQVLPNLINFQPKDQKQIILYLDIMDIVNSVLLLIITFTVYRRLRKRTQKESLPIIGKGFPACLIMGMAAAGLIFLISLLFFTNDYASGRTVGGEKLLLMALINVFFAPLIEEFLFRGVVFGLLSRFRRGWTSILLSALIFAVYHWDLAQGINTFFLGLLLAYTYYRTNNIRYPILIHAVNNAFVVIVGYMMALSIRPYFNWISAAMILPTMWILFRFGREAVKTQEAK